MNIPHNTQEQIWENQITNVSERVNNINSLLRIIPQLLWLEHNYTFHVWASNLLIQECWDLHIFRLDEQTFSRAKEFFLPHKIVSTLNEWTQEEISYSALQKSIVWFSDCFNWEEFTVQDWDDLEEIENLETVFGQFCSEILKNEWYHEAANWLSSVQENLSDYKLRLEKCHTRRQMKKTALYLKNEWLISEKTLKIFGERFDIPQTQTQEQSLMRLAYMCWLDIPALEKEIEKALESVELKVKKQEKKSPQASIMQELSTKRSNQFINKYRSAIICALALVWGVVLDSKDSSSYDEQKDTRRWGDLWNGNAVIFRNNELFFEWDLWVIENHDLKIFLDENEKELNSTYLPIALEVWEKIKEVWFDKHRLEREIAKIVGGIFANTFPEINIPFSISEPVNHPQKPQSKILEIRILWTERIIELEIEKRVN